MVFDSLNMSKRGSHWQLHMFNFQCLAVHTTLLELHHTWRIRNDHSRFLNHSSFRNKQCFSCHMALGAAFSKPIVLCVFC